MGVYKHESKEDGGVLERLCITENDKIAKDVIKHMLD